MNQFEVHAYLNSFVNFEVKLHKLSSQDFNLSPIQEFLRLAGNPDHDLKIIHVAGTKGKGSTCAFMASMLQQAGYTVGLYTSPHLHKLNERIRILSPSQLGISQVYTGSISDEDLAEVLSFLSPFAAVIENKGYSLTFFEVMTVAAVYYFAKQKVDIVVLETGLGGRLDATNAVNSAVAVITPISLDHMQILGPDVGSIAVEKAGIIKNSHQQVVLAPQEKEAMDQLLKRCEQFGIKPISVFPEQYFGIDTGLKGIHQLVNAATAIEVIKILRGKGYKISDEAQRKGLKNIRWPGRFEIVKENPVIIVDCAHNEASSQALVRTLAEVYSQHQIIAVLGVSQDKDIKAICRHINQKASQVYLTKASHPRSHQFTLAEAKTYFTCPVSIIDRLPDAIETACAKMTAKDIIVITGSVFAVAEARAYILGENVSI